MRWFAAAFALVAAVCTIASVAASKREGHLRAAAAERRLTEAQRNDLVQALSAHRGQKVLILFAVGDFEARQYAQDFDSMFRQAGWVVFGPKASVPFGMELRYFLPPQQSPTWSAARALDDALVKGGTEIIAIHNPDAKQPPDILYLEVGPKKVF